MQGAALELVDQGPSVQAAIWQIEPADDGYVYIKNPKNGAYLKHEHGKLVAGTIDPNWFSAMWMRVKVNDDDVSALAAPRPTAKPRPRTLQPSS